MLQFISTFTAQKPNRKALIYSKEGDTNWFDYSKHHSYNKKDESRNFDPDKLSLWFHSHGVPPR
jgi:hypothetical protein